MRLTKRPDTEVRRGSSPSVTSGPVTGLLLLGLVLALLPLLSVLALLATIAVVVPLILAAAVRVLVPIHRLAVGVVPVLLRIVVAFAVAIHGTRSCGCPPFP